MEQCVCFGLYPAIKCLSQKYPKNVMFCRHITAVTLVTCTLYFPWMPRNKNHLVDSQLNNF